jgi:hypothetical protein
MNERINELARQASNQSFGHLRNTDFERKFSELIIKECMQICMTIEHYDDIGLSPEHCGHIRAGASFCREDIKVHFGVN